MASDIETYRGILVRTFPELQETKLSLLTEGWDSVAVDADGRLIFKFPRDAKAEAALAREHAVLERVRPALSMRVPELTLHDGPPLFSRHEKIPGEHLTAADYPKLSEAGRRRLGDQLGEFYAQLHAIDPHQWTGLPEVEIDPWPSPDQVEGDIEPVLPPDLRELAGGILAAWRALAPDPLGEVFSFFDGHGWNMAFDHEAGRLNGIFDFADSRFAPLQQDFIYPNFISRDLTARIIDAYEVRTGRRIDRRRVDLLTGVLFLVELAGHEAHPDKLPLFLETLRRWARSLSGTT